MTAENTAFKTFLFKSTLIEILLFFKLKIAEIINKIMVIGINKLLKLFILFNPPHKINTTIKTVIMVRILDKNKEKTVKYTSYIPAYIPDKTIQ